MRIEEGDEFSDEGGGVFKATMVQYELRGHFPPGSENYGANTIQKTSTRFERCTDTRFEILYMRR